MQDKPLNAIQLIVNYAPLDRAYQKTLFSSDT
jgi:hypothetical protein